MTPPETGPSRLLLGSEIVFTPPHDKRDAKRGYRVILVVMAGSAIADGVSIAGHDVRNRGLN
jgi:hypothetical protein